MKDDIKSENIIEALEYFKNRSNEIENSLNNNTILGDKSELIKEKNYIDIILGSLNVTLEELKKQKDDTDFYKKELETYEKMYINEKTKKSVPRISEEEFNYMNSLNDFDYHLKLNFLVMIKNTISLICCTILAITFKKWWIVLLALLFLSYIGKEEKENGKS